MAKNRHDLDDAGYLRGLAEALMHVPATYGTDGADVDRVGAIAKTMQRKVKPLQFRQPSGPHALVADALGITYRVSEGLGDDTAWEVRLHNSLIGSAPTKEEGMALAQANFAALVLEWVE